MKDKWRITDRRSSISPLGILVTWQPTTGIYTSKDVIHAGGMCTLAKGSLLLDVLCCLSIVLQLLIVSSWFLKNKPKKS